MLKLVFINNNIYINDLKYIISSYTLPKEKYK